jgi:hypothetical protein
VDERLVAARTTGGNLHECEAELVEADRGEGAPRARMPLGQKGIVAGLICLQIPSAVLFFPAAAIIILTGVGAPLSMILWRVGSMPFSLAMRRKAVWRSGRERKPESGQRPSVNALPASGMS